MTGLPPLKFETVTHNGRVYRVQLFNQWLLGGEWKDGKLPPVYWLSTGAPIFKQRQRVTGVRLDEYLVNLDGDPRWKAVIVLDGEPILHAIDEYGNVEKTQARLRISQVRLQMGDQTSTAIPTDKILSACIRVGAIAGYIESENVITAYLTDAGQMIAPDELDSLMGIERERRPAKEQYETALRAAIEFKKLKGIGAIPPNPETLKRHTVETFVSEVTGIRDGKSLLRNAKKQPHLQELAELAKMRESK